MLLSVKELLLGMDPDLGIDWKIPMEEVILSEKDSCHSALKDAAWLFDYYDKQDML